MPICAFHCSANISAVTCMSSNDLGCSCSSTQASCCSSSTDCSSSSALACSCSSSQVSCCSSSTDCSSSSALACSCSSSQVSCCSSSTDCSSSNALACSCSSSQVSCCSSSTDCSSSSALSCSCSSSRICDTSSEYSSGCCSSSAYSSGCCSSSALGCSCSSNACSCTASGESLCASCPTSGSYTEKQIDIAYDKDNKHRLVDNITDLNYNNTTYSVGIPYWRSNNYNVSSSTADAMSNEIIVTATSGTISVDYYILSQASYDIGYIIVYKDGTAVKTKSFSGYQSAWATYTYTISAAGTYKIEIKYVKNSGTNAGADYFYIRKAHINENYVEFTNNGTYGFNRLVWKI